MEVVRKNQQRRSTPCARLVVLIGSVVTGLSLFALPSPAMAPPPSSSTCHHGHPCMQCATYLKVKMLEAVLLPVATPKFKAKLRPIVSMTKLLPPVVRPRLDRSMTDTRQALMRLWFLNQSMVTRGSWPEAEKFLDCLAVDGLLRSSFDQC